MAAAGITTVQVRFQLKPRREEADGSRCAACGDICRLQMYRIGEV